MGTVNWLILLAIIAGVMILMDGLRRAHREGMANGQSAGVIKAHDARAERRTEKRTASVVTPRISVTSDVVPPDTPEAAPARSRQRSGRACSLIGATLHVRGRIEANEPLVVAGCVEGDIHAEHHCVTFLAAGHAGPSGPSPYLIASGTLRGDSVTPEGLSPHAGASFNGNLSAARLACGEGARLNGHFHIGTMP